jgi:hypothetical protein
MKVRLGILREYLGENFSVLVEGRIEDAREKYPDMEEEHFEQIVANQPAGSNNKYLMWTCKQVDELMADDPDPQAISLVIAAVRLFDGSKQRLPKKDLNQYKDTAEVEAAVDALGGASKNAQAKQAKADSDVIYQDDQFLVLRPHTAEASCKYGTGTKWCIAATASRNYFSSYSTSNNKFYFVIDKTAVVNSNTSKFAIVIINPQAVAGAAIQVYNAADTQVGLEPVKRHTGAKWEAIWAKIQEHLGRNPDTREVEDARKATDDHVKALMKGEKVSKEGLKKIAKDAKLSTPIITKMIAIMREYTGPSDYTDPRMEIIAALANRAAELTPEGAVELINYAPTTKPTGGGYWSGQYHVENLIKNAPLTPEHFRTIVEKGDPTNIGYIMQNPNVPDDIVANLAAKLPEIRDASLKRLIQRALLRSGTISVDQMREAMADTSTYGSIASDLFHYPELTAKLSPELLRMIPVKNGEELKKFLDFPNVPADLAADLITKHWKQLKKYDLYELLKNVKLPADMIEKIWDGKDPHIRASLLQNPAIGAATAKQFTLSKNSAYRFAVAHNTVTSPEDLTLLSTDESTSTRAAVAANPKTPAETLARLAQDEANAVRASVAGNSNTPVASLTALKRDSDDFVRKVVRKTLKSLSTATEAIQFMLSMSSMMLHEAIKDDSETPDIYTPNWRDLPAGEIDAASFISIFLLQNNGSAAREEIEDAWQSWRGSGGAKDLWASNKYSDEILRGATAGGRGWYWAPPGINSGAQFKLTPAGASVAMDILTKTRQHANKPRSVVNSSHAVPGKTYYTPSARQGLDITGYENGKLSMEEVMADSNGSPVMYGGKYQKASANRSRRRYRRERTVSIFKYVPANGGETRHVATFPKVQIPANAEVQFVKVMHGSSTPSRYGSSTGTPNKAVVKYDNKSVVIEFPLWAETSGTTPAEAEKFAPMPVKKATPPAVAAPAAAGAAARAPGTPKTTYKIYGKFKGAPAATRLKGQAYIAGDDTQFRGGEQAIISPEDGKLRVKKTDSDHSQLWDPTDG